MEILIALGIAIAIAARTFIRDNQAQANDAWSAAAAHLDLDYSRAAVFKPRRIQGQVQGNNVEISTVTRHTRKTRKRDTRYRVHYARPLHLGLNIAEKKLLSGISVLLGAQDIDTGDAVFDSRFVVKGNNLYRVGDFLKPYRRKEITDLFDELPGVMLDDEKIEWSSRGIVRESSELIDTLLRLSWAATKIYEGDPQRPVAIGAPINEASPGEPVARATDPETRLPPDPAATDAPAATETGAEAAADEAPEIGDAADVVDAGTPAETVHLAEASGDAQADPFAGPDADTVCNELFLPSTMSFEARKLFDERYRDQSIRWTGNLIRLSSYRIDLNFAGGPGTKATFNLNLNGSAAAGRTIQAIVQLPPDADAELRARIGEAITFEGTLAACDALVRSFHIADGQII